jgi:hypothetical protein
VAPGQPITPPQLSTPTSELASSGTTPTPTLTTITLSPTTASLTAGGSTQTISATKLDQNSSPITATLTWNSSNTSVATVSSSGVVTPLTAGTTNITATSGGITSNTTTITVTAAAVIPSGGSSTLSHGLVAYYPFDGDANDASGNNNNGTAVNNPTYTTGQIGQAMSFDGTTQYAYIASTPANLDLTTFTVSTWVFVPPLSGYPIASIMSTGLLNNNKGFLITSSNFNTAGFIVKASRQIVGGNQQLETGLYPCNVWTHVVVVVDGASVQFYRDGSAVSSSGTSWTAPVNSYIGTQFNIGQRQDGVQRWNGKIDDVRIYNRVLSADEVSQLYNGTLTYHAPTTSPQNQSLLASISAALANLIAEFKKYLAQ